MKITKLTVDRSENEGDPALVCTITWQDGSQTYCAHPWRNQNGLWASPEEARNPAEISAVLRSFAKAIEDYTKARAAA